MPIRRSLNVSLTPQLEQFVQDRVADGRYQTASEVIREGLRLLEHQEQARQASIEVIGQQLRRGSKQADKGQFLTPSAVLKQVASRRRRSKARA